MYRRERRTPADPAQNTAPTAQLMAAAAIALGVIVLTSALVAGWGDAGRGHPLVIADRAVYCVPRTPANCDGTLRDLRNLRGPAVVPVSTANGRIEGHRIAIGGIDLAASQRVLALTVLDGYAATSSTDAVVTERFARRSGLGVGAPLPIDFDDGTVASMRIVGIVESIAGLHDVIIGHALASVHGSGPDDVILLAGTADELSLAERAVERRAAVVRPPF